MVSKCLLLIIKMYQKLISPVLPARCRYYPTCSEYAKTAINWHGSYLGAKLAIKRVSRCHPFGGSGLDFVPIPLYKDVFIPLDVNFSITLSRCSLNHSVPCGTYLLDRGVYRDNISYVARMNRNLNK